LSLFCVTLCHLSHTGVGEPHHARKERHLLILLPSLHLLHHLTPSPHSFSLARVRRAVAVVGGCCSNHILDRLL
jgi:hypothetical protein